MGVVSGWQICFLPASPETTVHPVLRGRVVPKSHNKSKRHKFLSVHFRKLSNEGEKEEKIAIEVTEEEGLDEEEGILPDEGCKSMEPEPTTIIKRKSPSEPISTLCSSMRRQIISR